MFGYVTASVKELSKEQTARYRGVYCGICRQMRGRGSPAARLALSYDMAFLALLHMSLYEPEETSGKNACIAHPFRRMPWVDNEYIRYSADMNVLLAFRNARDDWEDEKKRSAKWMADLLEGSCGRIRQEWPRQYAATERCLEALARLEAENCPDPDAPAAVFGELMGELFVYREDLWAPTLRRMGDAMGRFIYLTDAIEDYGRDRKKGSYNPFLACGRGCQPDRWQRYQLMTMGRCADAYERLPLVQDKEILDNILYSGVWLRQKQKRKEGAS